MLCVELLGGEVQEEEPPHSTSFEQTQSVILMSQIPGGGLAYWNKHGIFAGISVPQKGDEPMVDEPVYSEPEPSEPEPSEPVVVTAMAQEYTDDGIKLPRNVSFAFYELGLGETVVPVSGTATSGFGYRDHPVSGTNEFHLALDIGAAEGTEIGAFADGVVEYIGTSDEFGNYLKINHDNNVSTFYAHCSKLLVHKGDQVTCGQTVALVGQTGNATGPHLHLTIEKDNIRLDPAYYVDLS
ncbi:MAG: M23 family metallopeptidase [Clostridiales bacterium]|nr:M23 family metallopeptidase [Clostridiales bacterium]